MQRGKFNGCVVVMEVVVCGGARECPQLVSMFHFTAAPLPLSSQAVFLAHASALTGTIHVYVELEHDMRPAPGA